MSESVTLKLQTPIQFGSEVIEELTFRPPTAKDYRLLPARDGYPFATLLALAGKLTGKPDAVIDKLAGADLDAVLEIAGSFMKGGRPTGNEPSPS